MKNIGKPCTGKPYARFDEGGLVMPALYSTLNSRNLGNRPGMGIAAAITYGGLMHGSSILPTVVIDRLP